MSTKIGRRVGYEAMVILAIVAGVFGIVFQFFQGWELLSFILGVAVLGGLIADSKDYEENEKRKLARSYQSAVEWLLLILLVGYAVIALSAFIQMDRAVVFLNGHWPGFMLAMMCLLMGIAGLRKGSD